MKLTELQAKQIAMHAADGEVDVFDVPPGSVVIFVSNAERKLRWIEVLEPNPRNLIAYDTGAGV